MRLRIWKDRDVVRDVDNVSAYCVEAPGDLNLYRRDGDGDDEIFRTIAPGAWTDVVVEDE